MKTKLVVLLAISAAVSNAWAYPTSVHAAITDAAVKASGLNDQAGKVMETLDLLEWASVGAIRRVDPLVFFGSLSATRFQARDQGGPHIRPGNIYGLRFGTALANAPASSLRAAFSVNVLDATRIDGVRVPTDDLNAFLEVGGSAVLTPATAIDIVVAAGLTRNTPDFRLMVSLPTRF